MDSERLIHGLAITRKVGETLLIDLGELGVISIGISKNEPGRSRIVVEADRSIPVYRTEIAPHDVVERLLAQRNKPKVKRGVQDVEFSPVGKPKRIKSGKVNYYKSASKVPVLSPKCWRCLGTRSCLEGLLVIPCPICIPEELF